MVPLNKRSTIPTTSIVKLTNNGSSQIRTRTSWYEKIQSEKQQVNKDVVSLNGIAPHSLPLSWGYCGSIVEQATREYPLTTAGLVSLGCYLCQISVYRIPPTSHKDHYNRTLSSPTLSLWRPQPTKSIITSGGRRYRGVFTHLWGTNGRPSAQSV